MLFKNYPYIYEVSKYLLSISQFKSEFSSIFSINKSDLISFIKFSSEEYSDMINEKESSYSSPINKL